MPAGWWRFRIHQNEADNWPRHGIVLGRRWEMIISSLPCVSSQTFLLYSIWMNPSISLIIRRLCATLGDCAGPRPGTCIQRSINLRRWLLIVVISAPIDCCNPGKRQAARSMSMAPVILGPVLTSKSFEKERYV